MSPDAPSRSLRGAATKAFSRETHHGHLGIWWFLSGEIILFGGFIASFILYRLAHPEWIESAKQLDTVIGSVNTTVLLTSSYTMVLAHRAGEAGNRSGIARWLAVTTVLGAAFLVIKGFEWNAKFHHDIFPNQGRFWAFYFTMTGLHALHLLIGVLINGVLALMAATGGGGDPAALGRKVEPAALYWHLVDVIWIFLFPLFYLG